MRIRLGIMPCFVLPTSLTDLAATAVRFLMWDLQTLTSTRLRSVGGSEKDPGATAVRPTAPIAEEPQRPVTFAGAHVRKYPARNARVTYHDSAALGEPVCQCALYDGPGPDARLIGVEYLVSDEVYRRMPAEERLYWHAHQCEIDAGVLRCPSGADAAEQATLVKARTLWGKVYPTWVSGGDYPRGPSQPFWSDTGELPLVLPPGSQAQLGKPQDTGKGHPTLPPHPPAASVYQSVAECCPVSFSISARSLAVPLRASG